MGVSENIGGMLGDLGTSAKGMLFEGGGEKALLYVYLVDLFALKRIVTYVVKEINKVDI